MSIGDFIKHSIHFYFLLHDRHIERRRIGNFHHTAPILYIDHTYNDILYLNQVESIKDNKFNRLRINTT